jgi:hypothetical protein
MEITEVIVDAPHWRRIYDRCHTWKTESWKLAGLEEPTEPIQTEETTNKIEKHHISRSSGAVSMFQTKFHQFQYERQKKANKPLQKTEDLMNEKTTVQEEIQYEDMVRGATQNKLATITQSIHQKQQQ